MRGMRHRQRRTLRARADASLHAMHQLLNQWSNEEQQHTGTHQSIKETYKLTDTTTDTISQTNVTAALAASVFHFGQIPIPDLKQYLKTQNIPIRI